ncbi:MAG TPA: DUF1778 domain-containing protein [Candidatus Binatia bacterium]|jgi:uncharacterized protein (DUF1778 family)
MLSFKDLTEAVDEPKTARLEQRTKPHVKREIQVAASLLGVDETAFVMSVAYERALAVIESHERTRLTAADRDAFLAAFDEDAPLSDAMRRANELHKKLVANAD